jgi:inner membrane protein
VDNVTHALVGAALGEAGLKRRTGLAMATLIIGANLPDLDVLAIPFDDPLTFRRGWTHGPLALLVLPFLLTAVIVGWDHWQSRRGTRPAERLPVRPSGVLLLAFAGVLSHPFLDWLNTYGIRLLMPFSHEWFFGDAVFIVDPWIWSALGAGVWLSRHRHRRDTGRPLRPARLALGVVAGYIAVMIMGSRAAERSAVREVEAVNAGPVERIMAGPVPVNPFRRELILDVGDAYRFGSVAWTPRAEVVLEPGRLPKRFQEPAVQAALPDRQIQNFLVWSRFPFFEVEPGEDRVRVHVSDARFSRTATGGWMSRSVVVTAPETGVVRPR